MSWLAEEEAAPSAPDAFRKHGAAALGRVLDGRQLEGVRASIDAMLPAHGVSGGYACIIHDAWRKSEVLAGLVPVLGSLACAAIDVPELVLFHDHVLSKPPGGDDMGWHQDYSYLPIDRADGMTLWIALDDVTVANGCLYYLLGSHVNGELRAAWGLGGSDDPRATLPPIEVSDDTPGVPAETAAGCALAHHTYLLHRSPRNQSTRSRRSWALSFVVPDARWSPRHSPHPRSAISPRHDGQALEADLPRVHAQS